MNGCCAASRKVASCVIQRLSFFASLARSAGSQGATFKATPLRPPGLSFGSPDGPDLPAPSSSAEELIATIRFEPRHVHTWRHLEALEDVSRPRVDSPQLALVTFPRAVPELSIDPRDSRYETVGLDGTKNRPGFGIDL